MNFKLLTFIIVIRNDSIERLENIICVESYLHQQFNTHVYVLESATQNNHILIRLLKRNTHYFFIEDHDNIFHRTFYINQLVKVAKTPYVSVWDADVIIPPTQIHQGLNLLQSGSADLVIPYDRRALDTTPILRKLFMQEFNLKILDQNIKKMNEINSPDSLGGAFMVNMESYKNAGMENEDFYGWGLEDGERFYRMYSLGYKIRRVQGPLFHLTHSRGINSMFQNPDQVLIKRKATLKMKRQAGI